MDAIVCILWLVRAVASGRRLPVCLLGTRGEAENGIVLAVGVGGRGGHDPSSVLLSRRESQILFSSSLGPLGRPLTSVGPSGQRAKGWETRLRVPGPLKTKLLTERFGGYPITPKTAPAHWPASASDLDPGRRRIVACPVGS